LPGKEFGQNEAGVAGESTHKPLGSEEVIMRDLLIPPDRPSLAGPDAEGNGESKSPSPGSPLALARIGFWLGGGVLGTAGCMLGVCMPDLDPVARVISALWWSIYLGCLGGSVGALIGLGAAHVRGGERWSEERPEEMR
jgi:hypothetical protein